MKTESTHGQLLIVHLLKQNPTQPLTPHHNPTILFRATLPRPNSNHYPGGLTREVGPLMAILIGLRVIDVPLITCFIGLNMGSHTFQSSLPVFGKCWVKSSRCLIVVRLTGLVLKFGMFQYTQICIAVHRAPKLVIKILLQVSRRVYSIVWWNADFPSSLDPFQNRTQSGRRRR